VLTQSHLGIADALLAPLLWAHALAATTWVGGTLVYILMAPRLSSAQAEARVLWRPFRETLRVGIGVFVLTGALMAAQRFASATLPPLYFGLLVVKVSLGIWMFSIARRIGAVETPAAGSMAWLRSPEWQVVVLGVIIYGVAITLRTIYEAAIRG